MNTYMTPFTDLTSIILMSTYAVWSTLLVYYEWHKNIDFDLSVPFGVITATLGFILPLQMNASIGKNKQCLDNYNAFCGDVVALAWQTIILTDGKGKNEQAVEDLFHIYCVFPTAVKWKFRDADRLKLDKLMLTKHSTSKGPMSGPYAGSNGTDVGKQHTLLLSKRSNTKIDPVDLMFLLMYDKIQELNAPKTTATTAGGKIVDAIEIRAWDAKKDTLVRTAERVYGSYGNMGNLDAYAPPRLFTAFLDISLFLYLGILPVSFDIDTMQYSVVWQGVIVIYFFLGINIVGKKVANAFVSTRKSGGAFQTVGASETDANHAIRHIYGIRKNIRSRDYKGMNMFQGIFANFPPNVRSKIV